MTLRQITGNHVVTAAGWIRVIIKEWEAAAVRPENLMSMELQHITMLVHLPFYMILTYNYTCSLFANIKFQILSAVPADYGGARVIRNS